jgi:trans-aconitate methyltransferase
LVQLRRLPGIVWRLAKDRTYASTMLLRLFPGRHVFQHRNNTRRDRYPEIFRKLQSELGRDSDVRILSFGCSTGEEVFTLRDYFPNAILKGIDVNGANIARCNRALEEAPDARIQFQLADSTAFETSQTYDAVLCMAVLRDGRLQDPAMVRCDPLLFFADFERTIGDFCRCLKPGGILAVRHANFRVRDTQAARGLETIFSADFQNRSASIFDSNNRLLPGEIYSETLFRKTAI